MNEQVEIIKKNNAGFKCFSSGCGAKNLEQKFVSVRNHIIRRITFLEMIIKISSK